MSQSTYEIAKLRFAELCKERNIVFNFTSEYTRKLTMFLVSKYPFLLNEELPTFENPALETLFIYIEMRNSPEKEIQDYCKYASNYHVFLNSMQTSKSYSEMVDCFQRAKALVDIDKVINDYFK